MLLIHPPVSKPSEPPPGIAALVSTVRAHGLPCEVWDANLEGLLWLLHRTPQATDTWTGRALRHRDAHLAFLRHEAGYRHFERYKRAVEDLSRLLEQGTPVDGVRVGFSNYLHGSWAPVRSADLLRAAENPEANPFFSFFSSELRFRITRREHDAAGFSLNFLSQALTTFAMIGFLRREAPSIRIVLGGGLVTSWMRRPGWRNPFEGLVDAWVDGPGEKKLPTLLGIQPAALPQPTPTPDYSLLPLRDYFAPGVILPYSTARGCYWSRCGFCPERAEGNPYIPLHPDRVFMDLERLAAAMEPTLIHFVDSALSPSILERFCRERLEACWHGFARITEHLQDLDFCRELRRSGCVMLELGVESGSQEVLDRERKGVRVEAASRALRCLRDAGISTYVYLLFGSLSESEDEARQTLDFAVKHIDCIDFLNLAIFNLPIHGERAETLEQRSHYEGDLSLYTGFKHPKGWSRTRVRQFIDKEFKRHPAIRTIIRRDPPHFTSNHAPFFGRSWPPGRADRSVASPPR